MRVGQHVWIAASGMAAEVAGFDDGLIQVYLDRRNEVVNVLPREVVDYRPSRRPGRF